MLSSIASLVPLPSSLLLLLLSSTTHVAAQQHPSPTDLSPEFKYYPEHEQILRRDLEVKRKLQLQTPIGVRKLSPDPGEKFYLDYWIFDEEPKLWLNDTAEGLSQHLRVHYGAQGSGFSQWTPDSGLRRFSKRDFKCPDQTTACPDRPENCCKSGTTCQILNGGDVGCCPSGQTCGTVLGDCPNGSTSCASQVGGGCCLPGYACVQQGCIQTALTTILVGPSTSAPSGASTTTVTSVTTITRSNAAPEVVTTTVLIVDTVTTSLPDPRTSTATSRSTVTTTDCPDQYRLCPEGGCCHTDRACASGDRCPASTSSGLQPPDRPVSDTTTTSSPNYATTLPSGACPTGFYGCKAFHQGGCCQTDRDCDTTSCPPIGSATVIDTGGVTIAAPTGVDGASLPTGTCPSGFNSCAPSLSGGCCLTGYACQVSTCVADSTEVSGGQGKVQPNSAAVWTGEVDVLVLSFAVVACSAVLSLGIWL